jgi:hypothetical protein
VGTPVEAVRPPKSGFPPTAAFFDLDKTECYAYGEEKAVQVRRLAAERGYSLPGCYAYSDSITDRPLLEAVGNPRVVNPDRALRRIATARGWPVLSFSTAERNSAQPMGMEAP